MLLSCLILMRWGRVEQRSRWLIASVGVGLLAAVVIGMNVVSEERDPGPAPTEKYTACVAAAGIDVGGAQPVYDQAGALTWMMTGVDVPVDIHSSCFEFVGGTGVSLTTSSWGN